MMSDSLSELPLFNHASRACVIEATVRSEQSESEKAHEILQHLLKEPLSTTFVESNWHRGQAAIGVLRDEGHVIDTVQRQYVYRGYNPGRVKVSKELQSMYYTTSHWRAKAFERKQKDGFACTRCGSRVELETHHWKYDLFNESIDDLETFCHSCHEWIHGIVKGSSVHFPRWIDKAVADRIKSEATS
jgi:hypothetical protein